MRNRPLCFLCLLILILQGVIFIIKGGVSNWDIPADSIFRVYEGQTKVVRGQVYRKSETTNLQILYLKNNSIDHSNILIYMKNKNDISIGETVCIRGTIGVFERARNPGNYDQALYYACQKIYGYVWCDELIEVTGKENVIAETLHQWKTKWKHYLQEMLGEEEGTVLCAMLLGEKGDMDANVKELYQKNGIGHLLAISGLHISFIGLLIYKILRKLGIGYVASGLLSMMALGGYAFMIGFGVSIFRAVIMLSLRIIAEMTGRIYDLCTALCLAATVTITMEPMYFADAGFWMSYGAVLGIVLVLPKIQKCFRSKGEIVSSLCASLAINIILFPLLLWFYFEIPTYSILWNLFAIPLMSVLLGAGLLGSFFCWCLPVAKTCFLLCAKILNFYQWLGVQGSQLPMARIVLGKPKLWMVILYYLVLTCVLMGIQLARRKRYLWWSLLFLCMITFAIPSGGEVRVTMIDVGQGDCIFFQGPQGGTYLIDGGSSDVEQVGKYRIEPFLKSQGVGTLDYVFVTHGDGDHCNGILEMLTRQNVGVKIRYLVLPYSYAKDECLQELQDTAVKCGVKVLRMKAGDCITEGTFSLQCLQPGKQENLGGNAGSMVLEQRYGKFSMLCTGDIEGEGEKQLIQHIKRKKYRVLKVSHHGSKNSTTEPFLETIAPQIALISAGINNSYQHPHVETIERLKVAKCKIYCTKESGAITMRTDGNSLTIETIPFRL